MDLSEREVLKQVLKALRVVYKHWLQVERRQVLHFKNQAGQRFRVGKAHEADIGGWVLQGHYIAKPVAIEVKKCNFNPLHIYGPEKARFLKQCDYLRQINNQGGIGFWLNQPSLVHQVLAPVLFRGAHVQLNQYNQVVINEQKFT
jgi:hypothetical protein